MRSLRKTLLLAALASVLLVLAILHSWTPRASTAVDAWQRPGLDAERRLQKRIPDADPSLSNISFRVRARVARYGAPLSNNRGPTRGSDAFPTPPPPTPHTPPSRSMLARNGCVCEGEGGGVNLPFAQLLFPRVSALALHTAFNASELEDVKKRRAKEFKSFQER